QAGILPQKDSDQAASELAQAQVAAVTARRAQQLATLRAPLAGVVTRMTAVLGASVDVSQALIQIADPNALDVVFNVSPADAARIDDGDSVAVTAGESAAGDPLGSGTVTGVAAAVDSLTRAVAVRARLRHPARALRLGESLLGRIVTAVVPRAVTVPVAALVPAAGGEGFQVFVVDSERVAHVRPVTVGGRSEVVAEIVAGLAAGEVVVTNGAYALQLVRARVSQIQSTLPPDLDIDIERLTPSLFPILSYNLEGGDPATLYDIARYEIKPLISRVPGVGRVDVQGTDVREIEVVA